MVSVLAIGLKRRGFKPGRDDGFIRAIKILNTPSFGGEMSCWLHVVRFYDMLNNSRKYERDILHTKSNISFGKIPLICYWMALLLLSERAL
jgi:hypothetical protein